MTRGTKLSCALPWLLSGAVLLGACSSTSTTDETVDDQTPNAAGEVVEVRSDDDSAEAPSSIGDILDEAGEERDYVGCYETVFASAGVQAPDSVDDMAMALEDLDESAKLGFQECVRFVNSQSMNSEGGNG